MAIDIVHCKPPKFVGESRLRISRIISLYIISYYMSILFMPVLWLFYMIWSMTLHPHIYIYTYPLSIYILYIYIYPIYIYTIYVLFISYDIPTSLFSARIPCRMTIGSLPSKWPAMTCRQAPKAWPALRRCRRAQGNSRGWSVLNDWIGLHKGFFFRKP